MRPEAISLLKERRRALISAVVTGKIDLTICYTTKKKAPTRKLVSACFLWLPKTEEAGHWDESVSL